MITKMFTSKQALEHLSYAITCGFCFEKFIYGKGVYGNRVSLIRDKSPLNLYNTNTSFKTSSFHAVEGIKALELPQTILVIRKKLEEFFTSKENFLEFLDGYKAEFVTEEDKQHLADNWFNSVSKKLLVSSLTDFQRLNNFLIANIVLQLPMGAQLKIAKFRKEQIIALVTQQIIPEDFGKAQLSLMPTSQEKLVALKQKLLKQKMGSK